MRGWKLAGVGLAVGAMVLAGCGDDGPGRVTAEQVVQKCNNNYGSLTLSADKKSISYNFSPGTQTEEDRFKCVLKETGAPSSVETKIGNTRPMDGTQTAEWDGWELTWSYGGRGKGSDLLFEEK